MACGSQLTTKLTQFSERFHHTPMDTQRRWLNPDMATSHSGTIFCAISISSFRPIPLGEVGRRPRMATDDPHSPDNPSPAMLRAEARERERLQVRYVVYSFLLGLTLGTCVTLLVCWLIR
jgi:hypothetical protein